MRIGHVRRLEDFGTRSLVNHALMAITFIGAIISAVFLEGELGEVLFIALLTFTGGMWVAHSIHSLGNVGTEEGYTGILNELFDVASHPGGRFDLGRFGRLITLIGAVSAVSLLVSADTLDGVLLPVAVVAIGTIALITAMTAFLIAVESAYAMDEYSGMSTEDRA